MISAFGTMCICEVVEGVRLDIKHTPGICTSCNLGDAAGNRCYIYKIDISI